MSTTATFLYVCAYRKSRASDSVVCVCLFAVTVLYICFSLICWYIYKAEIYLVELFHICYFVNFITDWRYRHYSLLIAERWSIVFNFMFFGKSFSFKIILHLLFYIDCWKNINRLTRFSHLDINDGNCHSKTCKIYNF